MTANKTCVFQNYSSMTSIIPDTHNGEYTESIESGKAAQSSWTGLE